LLPIAGILAEVAFCFGLYYSWSRRICQVLRTTRSCHFDIRLKLVFLTLIPGEVFDDDALARLRRIFERVCEDFESQLLEMSGHEDRVAFVVRIPPKVAVSRLVNSLKCVSSRRLKRERPDLGQWFLKGRSLWSPSYSATV
jgi:putative transposase